MALTEQPCGELGPPLVTVRLDERGGVASLHLDEQGVVLWLRETGVTEALGRADSVAVTRRAVNGSHVLLAGDFGCLRVSADGVIFEDSRRIRHRAKTCADGWLLAIPASAPGRGTLFFTRGDLVVQSVELPPLEDAGTALATFYGPSGTD
jgi:hypothetical protein